MGKIMSHGTLEFPGGSLDKIDPGGPMGMKVDKARRERKPIEAQSPAPASPRLLYGLGADGEVREHVFPIDQAETSIPLEGGPIKTPVIDPLVELLWRKA